MEHAIAKDNMVSGVLYEKLSAMLLPPFINSAVTTIENTLQSMAVGIALTQTAALSHHRKFPRKASITAGHKQKVLKDVTPIMSSSIPPKINRFASCLATTPSV